MRERTIRPRRRAVLLAAFLIAAGAGCTSTSGRDMPAPTTTAGRVLAPEGAVTTSAGDPSGSVAGPTTAPR